MKIFEHRGWRVARWTAGLFASNVYLIIPEGVAEAVVVDAGGAAGAVARYCRSSGIELSRIILTHNHLDHTLAARRLKRLTGAKLLASAIDVTRNKGLKPLVFGKGADALNDGDSIELGPLSIKVIATPGHTKGGITLSIKDALFTGDTLFAGGVGRTDLKGGNFDQLINSIRRLLKFPDDTVVYPGHGPSTTIGREKTENPFIR